jgi:hypothetical protein
MILSTTLVMVLALVADPAPGPAPATNPPASPAPTAAPRPAPGRVPTLDELLGTKPATKPTDPAPGAQAPVAPGALPEGDPNAKDLDRALSAEELGDLFEQAVTLMGDASTRLAGSKDAGLTTQRVQEDILRRLDTLISQMQNQQQQQSSSSSSSSQQQQGQQQPNQPRPGRQGESGQAGSGENTGQENMPPGRQDGQLNPQLDSARAAWGALPARVRDILLQGSSDRFSSRYQRLTEAYYRRLAEQGSAGATSEPSPREGARP